MTLGLSPVNHWIRGRRRKAKWRNPWPGEGREKNANLPHRPESCHASLDSAAHSPAISLFFKIQLILQEYRNRLARSLSTAPPTGSTNWTFNWDKTIRKLNLNDSDLGRPKLTLFIRTGHSNLSFSQLGARGWDQRQLWDILWWSCTLFEV